MDKVFLVQLDSLVEIIARSVESQKRSVWLLNDGKQGRVGDGWS